MFYMIETSKLLCDVSTYANIGSFLHEKVKSINSKVFFFAYYLKKKLYNL